MTFLSRTVVCTIQNSSDQTLTRKRGHLSHGEWVSGFPPDYIRPGEVGTWSSQTAGLFTGVQGIAEYSLPDGSVFEVRWNNPYVGENSFSQARTPNGDQTSVPASGDDPHADDVNVTYVFGPLSPPATSPQAAMAPAPILSIPDVPAVLDIVADCKNITHVSKPSRYDRCAAIEYAKKFHMTPCSDGFVALNSQPAYHEFGPNDLDQELESVGKSLPMDDCTHFVSSCIGSPFDAKRIGIPSSGRGVFSPTMPRIKAGGLYIPGDKRIGNPWIYGLIGVPQLMSYLLDSGIGQIVSVRRGIEFTLSKEGVPAGIEAGDLIVKYFGEDDSATVPVHFMFYLGIALTGEFAGKPIFACHTFCRIASWPITDKDCYKFIRIKV